MKNHFKKLARLLATGFFAVALIVSSINIPINAQGQTESREFEDWVAINELVEDPNIAEILAKEKGVAPDEPIPPYMLAHFYSLDINVPFTTLKGLNHFPNLSYFTFTNSNLTNISELKEHTNIETLYIKDNTVEIQNLEEVTGLTNLILEGVGFASEVALASDTEVVTLIGTGIHSLSGNLAQMKTIALQKKKTLIIQN